MYFSSDLTAFIKSWLHNICLYISADDKVQLRHIFISAETNPVVVRFLEIV